MLLSVTYFLFGFWRTCAWWCDVMECFHVVMLARSESRIERETSFFFKRHENLWLHDRFEAIVIGRSLFSEYSCSNFGFWWDRKFHLLTPTDQSRAIFSLRDHHQFREPRNASSGRVWDSFQYWTLNPSRESINSREFTRRFFEVHSVLLAMTKM